MVKDRIISSMISSMELERPSLPQWDLGNVLGALAKPPYENLRDASLEHLTYKTVFFLEMASAGSDF